MILKGDLSCASGTEGKQSILEQRYVKATITKILLPICTIL